MNLSDFYGQQTSGQRPAAQQAAGQGSLAALLAANPSLAQFFQIGGRPSHGPTFNNGNLASRDMMTPNLSPTFAGGGGRRFRPPTAGVPGMGIGAHGPGSFVGFGGEPRPWGLPSGYRTDPGGVQGRPQRFTPEQLRLEQAMRQATAQRWGAGSPSSAMQGGFGLGMFGFGGAPAPFRQQAAPYVPPSLAGQRPGMATY